MTNEEYSKLFESVGVTGEFLTNMLKNPKNCALLAETITEAHVEKGCKKEIGALL